MQDYFFLQCDEIEVQFVLVLRQNTAQVNKGITDDYCYDMHIKKSHIFPSCLPETDYTEYVHKQVLFGLKTFKPVRFLYSFIILVNLKPRQIQANQV